MALRSMTTFSRVESVEDTFSVILELRSVNGRYCDVHSRLPRWLVPLEDRVRKLIQERLVRGRIEVSIQLEGGSGTRPVFVPDVDLGRSYLAAARALARDLGLEDRVDLSLLLSTVRDVMAVREPERDLEDMWPRLLGPLNSLLDRAEAMAKEEGAALTRDLEGRLAMLEGWLLDIDRRRDEHLLEAQTALGERIRNALAAVDVDPSRLAQEAAILADRLDITEEIVRAQSHVAQFRRLLGSEESTGRRLDFLLQELFREVNTMAAKSADAVISQSVVEIKAELEKVREQVQNVV